MDNKGQTLVTFVLIIPIILIVFILVIDYGLISLEKRKLSSTISDSIKYGVNNMDNSDIKSEIVFLINKNIKEDNIESLNVDINDSKVSVDITYKCNTIFNEFNNKIVLSYYGYKDNNEVKIIKR